MKIILISDTHGKHEAIELPKGDMIIHAGDITSSGQKKQVMSFLNWFKSLDYQYKIFICGNHDFLFEKSKAYAKSKVPQGVIYLQDNSIEIEGIKIYGSPYTPKFFDWAFMGQGRCEMKRIWKYIPNNTDILITHGPPYSILDSNDDGESCGCEDLLERIMTVKPKVHVFGHIHESYGIWSSNGTIHINASLLNENYVMTNKPIVLDYPESSEIQIDR